MDKLYLNIKEASEILGVSKLTLRNWDKAGKLHALRHPISNYRVYKTEDLKKLLHKMESGEKPIRAKIERKPRNTTNTIKGGPYKVKVHHLE